MSKHGRFAVSFVCFLQPLDPLNPKYKERIDKKRGQYCFFDIETMKVFDEEIGKTVLKPNLIVFQFENGDKVIFAREDCLKEFSEFLFVGKNSLVSTGDYYTIVGHNAACFDSFYILQSFIQNIVEDPNIFFDGKSPLKISMDGSFTCLQAPLSKLPVMFDLPVKKGRFPHDFNVPKNQNYVGRIPSPHYYKIHERR